MPHNIIRFMATAALVIFALPAIAGSEISRSSTMKGGASTFPPLGHRELCNRHAFQCRSVAGRTSTRKGAVVLTGARWQQLKQVNRRINRQIIARSDRRTYNKLDFWSLSGRYGDCEDYALRKRQALLRQGWPSSALLLTTARDHRRRPHAVLVVKTHRGDYVLDNLNSSVKPWRSVPYQWLKQQSQGNPGRWVSLSGYKKYSSEKMAGSRFASKAEARKYLQLVLRKIKTKKQNRQYAW
ncbi:MAG: transglutaminase-like cysteine peptidase [Methyloligellaceae bacterium]